MLLTLKCMPLTHPYAENPSYKDDIWSHIVIEVREENKVVDTVLDIQWDAVVLIEWILNNQEYLISEEMPEDVLRRKSLAESIAEFYEVMNPDKEEDDVAEQKLYSYRERHGLRFALRGVNINDIYIGVFNGVGSVSFYDQDKVFNYFVRLDRFIRDAQIVYDNLIGAKRSRGSV